MNKIIISGRLTRDPELKTVSGGLEVCRISVAVNRRKGKDGTQKADFFDCDAWNKTGAVIAQYFHKGDGIVIIGRMESNKAEKDGKTTTYWGINVDEFEFPQSSRKADGGAIVPPPPTDGESGMAIVNPEELPF